MDQMDQLERILETYANWGNYDFYFALGGAKQKKEQFEEAIKCYEKFLEAMSCRSNNGISLLMSDNRMEDILLPFTNKSMGEEIQK